MNSFYLFSMTKPPYLASIVHYWSHKFVKKFESKSYTNVSEIIKVAIKLIAFKACADNAFDMLKMILP